MKNHVLPSQITNWVFGLVVLVLGVLNILLVHPVPGIAYLLLSLVYFLPENPWFRSRFGPTILPIAKIILGIVIIWFTLGVSDLGDMID